MGVHVILKIITYLVNHGMYTSWHSINDFSHLHPFLLNKPNSGMKWYLIMGNLQLKVKTRHENPGLGSSKFSFHSLGFPFFHPLSRSPTSSPFMPTVQAILCSMNAVL